MKEPMQGNRDPILGLENPNSKVCCLMLYLYSMEIGNPQLYADVNRVVRNLDKNYLKELGPFLHALGRVTAAAESYKSAGEKIAPGNTFGGAHNNMAGSFLLWRGASMKQEWVHPYA